MSITYRNLKRDARDFHANGFTIRESVQLAAEHAEPYPQTVTPYWNRSPYDRRYAGEYRMARHFVPSEFRYQNPNEWRSRNSH